MGKVSDYLTKAVRLISENLLWVGMASLIMMMFLMTADVVMRYAFNNPIKGSLEINELIMILLIFCALAYTHNRRGHVSVQFLVSLLPKKAQAALEAVTTFVVVVFFALCTWQSLVWANISWRAQETSQELYISFFPFKIFLAIGVGALCLELIIQLGQSLAALFSKGKDAKGIS